MSDIVVSYLVFSGATHNQGHELRMEAEVISILDQLLQRMLIVDSILISVANACTSDM